MAAGALTITINAIRSLRSGEPAPANPWNAGTLEWATSSPPPVYNFHPEPMVGSLNPVWQDPPDMPLVVGLRPEKREVLVVKVVEAEPDHRFHSPYPSIWPFVAGLATTAMFIASIFTPWGLVWGSIPVTLALIGWFWPREEEINEETHPPEKACPDLEAAGGRV
jgi:cytochrome c oxidase subunit 1